MERLKTWIDNGQHNREVVFYLRFATGTDPALVRTVAKNALATKDDIAALYVIAAIIARDDLHNAASLDAAFIPCLNLLTEKHDARWVDQAWFQPTAKTFFASLSPAHHGLCGGALVGYVGLFPTDSNRTDTAPDYGVLAGAVELGVVLTDIEMLP